MNVNDYIYFIDKNGSLSFSLGDSILDDFPDGVIAICYSSDIEYDTLHKHGNKKFVRKYYEETRNKFLSINAIDLANEFQYIEIPIKYYEEVNKFIHISATKNITKFLNKLKEEELIIDVEVIS